MNHKNNIITKEEYRIVISENQEIIIKKEKKKNQEINIFFENVNETGVISNLIKLLTKYYIEDILDNN